MLLINYNIRKLFITKHADGRIGVQFWMTVTVLRPICSVVQGGTRGDGVGQDLAWVVV